jgi:hypothetical protein
MLVYWHDLIGVSTNKEPSDWKDYLFRCECGKGFLTTAKRSQTEALNISQWDRSSELKRVLPISREDVLVVATSLLAFHVVNRGLRTPYRCQLAFGKTEVSIRYAHWYSTH